MLLINPEDGLPFSYQEEANTYLSNLLLTNNNLRSQITNNNGPLCQSNTGSTVESQSNNDISQENDLASIISIQQDGFNTMNSLIRNLSNDRSTKLNLPNETTRNVRKIIEIWELTNRDLSETKKKLQLLALSSWKL